jgi:hypothetical protein
MKSLLILAALIFSFAFPVFAQERIIVEKATGNIVDVGDSTLQYDTRYFDNLDYPRNPIPEGADFRKYVLDASGKIVLRPSDELKTFGDEWRKDLVSRIDALFLPPDMKSVLLEIVKSIRR